MKLPRVLISIQINENLSWCKRCGGEGIIEDWEQERLEICPDCNGSGLIYKEEINENL